MIKINRRYNTQRKRLERWYNIRMKLSEFEGLINTYDGASPEEVKIMRTIHSKLYECSVLAKEYIKEEANVKLAF